MNKKRIIEKSVVALAMAMCVLPLSAKEKKVKETSRVENTAIREKVKLVKMVKKMKKFELSSCTTMMRKAFKNEIASEDVTVNMYPQKGLAALELKHNLIKTRLSFDEAGRRAFIKAYELYCKDYEDHKLSRSINKKPAYVYGRCRGRVEWGPFQYSVRADPEVKFGYVFIGKSPWFVVRVCEAELSEKRTDEFGKYIGDTMYFTRANAGEIAAVFDEAYIANSIQEIIGNSVEVQAVEMTEDEENSDEDYEEVDLPAPVRTDIKEEAEKAKKEEKKSAGTKVIEYVDSLQE